MDFGIEPESFDDYCLCIRDKNMPVRYIETLRKFNSLLQPVYRLKISLINLSFFLAENDQATDLTIVPTVKVVKDVINDLK